MKKFYLSLLFISYIYNANAQWVADTNVRNVICNRAGIQYQPGLCKDDFGGAIICWTDLSFTPSVIEAQRIDSAGHIKWIQNGILISDTSIHTSAFNPEIISDSAGGAFIVYESGGAADHIYAVRIDSNGTQVWPSAVAIDVAGDGRIPLINSDEHGGAIINWYRYPGPQIYVQWIDKDGNVHLPANGLQITNSVSPHYNSYAAYSGDSTAYIVYSEGLDLLVNRFDSTGVITWTNPDTLTHSFSTYANEYAIRAHAAANRNAFVFWNDTRSGAKGLYGQRINENGAELWTAGGQPVDTNILYVNSISVAPDGIGGDYIGYGSSARIQRVGVNGVNKFTPSIQLCPGGSEVDGIIRYDGSYGAIMAWQDGRGDYGVYAQRVDSSGTLLWRSCGVPVYTNDNGGTNNYLRLISNEDGTGIAVFLYTQSDVYAAKVENPFSTVGLKENILAEINLFPNPTTGIVNINISDLEGKVTLSVFDLSGRMLKEVLLTQKSNLINLNLAAGLYLVSLRNNDYFFSGKLIIDK